MRVKTFFQPHLQKLYISTVVTMGKTVDVLIVSILSLPLSPASPSLLCLLVSHHPFYIFPPSFRFIRYKKQQLKR